MKQYLKLKLAGLLAASAVVSACGGGDNVPGVPIPFEVIHTINFSGVRTPRFTVTRNSAEWEALWIEHRGQVLFPLPPLDFSKDMAIGVFLGERPSLCYAVEITSIDKTSERVTVQYKEITQAPGVLCPTSISTPSQIVSVPIVELPVEFVAVP